MATNPDSALVVLESIDSPETMSKPNYAEYCLLLTEAQDKTYYPFTSDSVIRVAAEYYQETKNKQKLPKAYYYMGRVHQELKQIPYALEYYLEAEKIAEDDFEDIQLMSRIYNSIGSIYTLLHIYEDALVAYKKSEQYLYACADFVGVPFVLRDMARIYHVTEKKDSAVYYYEQAIYLAKKMKNQDALATSLTEIAGVYNRLGKYAEAKASLSEISSSMLRGNLFDQTALVYANYYQYTGLTDSVLFYLNQSLLSRSIQTKATSYYRLYQIAQSEKNYKQALEYADLYYAYKDTIIQEKEREESLRIKNLYNYQKVSNEKEQLQQEQNKTHWQVLLLSSSLFLITILFTLVFFYLKQCQKNKTLLQENKLRLKEEQYKNSQKQHEENLIKIELLEQQLQERGESSDSADDKLLENQVKQLKQDNIHIELTEESKKFRYEKFVSSSIYRTLRNHSKEKCMSDELWVELQKKVNQIYDSFDQKLIILHPQISKQELTICYLVKAKFPVKNIASLIGRAPSTVSLCRSRLYEKTHNVSGSAEDFYRFIDNL